MVEARTTPGPLRPPRTDSIELSNLLVSRGYHDDVQPVQYAAWAEGVGLFDFLYEAGSASIEEIVAGTVLSEIGADALVGVLASMGLLLRTSGEIALAPLTREYLVAASPFYMGKSFYVTCKQPLPTFIVQRQKMKSGGKRLAAGQKLARDPATAVGRLLRRTLKRLRGWEFGGRRILENQHSRNLPVSVAAAHLELFDHAQCVVDMAGGSGTFSIPLAQRYPGMRIILTDLPKAMSQIRRLLKGYGLKDRVELVGMDVFSDSWPIPECDVIFFGNFIHGFKQEICVELACKSRQKLRPGGILVFHEMVWNENRDGPVKTALWNVTMRYFGGEQRTVAELQAMLKQAGFVQLFATPTTGGFVAVGGVRPE